MFLRSFDQSCAIIFQDVCGVWNFLSNYQTGNSQKLEHKLVKLDPMNRKTLKLSWNLRINFELFILIIYYVLVDNQLPHGSFYGKVPSTSNIHAGKCFSGSKGNFSCLQAENQSWYFQSNHSNEIKTSLLKFSEVIAQKKLRTEMSKLFRQIWIAELSLTAREEASRFSDYFLLADHHWD